MVLQTEYIIERKKVKHARINVNEEKRVKLIIPEDFSQDDISRLLSQKESWIKKQQSFFSQEQINPVKLEKGQVLLFGEAYQPDFDIDNTVLLEKWYKSQAKNYITTCLGELATLYKFKYNKVFVRDTKTKWGNCSKDNHLSFNWRLIKAPKYVIDYLILHELTHTLILKHTHSFWLKLFLLCPDYKQASDWLVKYGKTLF